MFFKKISLITFLGVVAIVIFAGAISADAELLDDSKAFKVSGGEDHTLVLTANKLTWACGPNGGDGYHGVLGTNSTNEDLDEISLVRVENGAKPGSDWLEDINDIAAGWKHSLALDVNGLVWSWGWNSEGQLGNDSRTEQRVPVQVESGEQDPGSPSTYLQYIRSISAGRSGEHSLAADANGYAYAWGRNVDGQLGNGESGIGERELTPVEVNDVGGDGRLEGIISVSAGENHSMGLEDDDPCHPTLTVTGRVYTWGDNDFSLGGSGVLGAGSISDKNRPVYVLSGEQDSANGDTLLEHIVAISAGWDHSLALEKDDPNDPNLNGQVYAWGNNGLGYYYEGSSGPRSDGGRLGNGTSTGAYNTPVVVHAGAEDANGLEHIIAVSAGEGHSMALDANGYVYTWGDNKYAQLGNGSRTDSDTPVKVRGGWQNPDDPNDPNSFLSNIVSISAGYWHSFAVDADGVIWTWGRTDDGRIGLGDIAYADPNICTIPHRIPVVYNDEENSFDFGIKKAVGNASSGDVLTASWGIYYEVVSFLAKSLTLESIGLGTDVVERTIIDGTYSPTSYCVYLASKSDSVVSGFTIANSKTDGVFVYGNSSGTVVRNNIIRDNARNGIWFDRVSSPLEVRSNWIYDNAANGIAVDTLTADDVTVSIFNNTIIDNGTYGIYAEEANDVNILNCIVWDNTSNELYAADSGTLDVRYSCIEGGYGGGTNISSDPCFVDAAGDDYHLDVNSLCYDAGDPNYVEDANETDIDGNPRVMEPNGGRIDMGADEDLPHCNSDYNDWVELGRPDCWLTPYQCDGDAAVDIQVIGWPVYTNDLVLLADNWQKKAEDANFNACADIDHKSQVIGWRVYTNDLIVITTWWQKLEYLFAGDCIIRGCGEAAMGSGASMEFTSGEMLDWLAEIWLDPKVRESMDAEIWLKLYQSLKKESLMR